MEIEAAPSPAAPNSPQLEPQLEAASARDGPQPQLEAAPARERRPSPLPHLESDESPLGPASGAGIRHLQA